MHQQTEQTQKTCQDNKQQNSKPPFKKVLYEDQPYEDNYTGSEFLAELKANAHVQPYDYKLCVLESCAFCQQLSLVAIFCVCFRHLLYNFVPIDLMVALNMVMLFIGYGALFILTPEKISRINFLRQVKSIVLVALTLLGLSPVLRTLTLAYSTDTIYAMTCLFVGIHLFAHDYAYVNGYTESFQCTLSLNSIIFTAVLFASRLPSAVHSFAIIAFAIELFAMLPKLRHKIKRWSNDIHALVTWLLFCVTTALLMPLSWLVTFLYVLASGFVTFVVPLWLIYVQQFKDEIQGPWDEARIPSKKQ